MASKRIRHAKTAAYLIALAGFVGPLLASGAGRADAEAASARQHLTVVELYQSQGCSSCPPANANLNAIASRSDVLALSFAVTYWDYLGWKDSFAKEQFTQRQWAYAHYNDLPNVATPQVWINGRKTIIGYDRSELNDAIRASANNGPELSIDSKKIRVAAGHAPRGGGDVWVAFYDPRTIDVPVGRGENSGRTLPHRNIVRQLVKVGQWTGTAASFSMPPVPHGLSAASFVQAGAGGPIMSAAKL